MDAEPAPVGLAVVLTLNRYVSVLHLHHVMLSDCVNTTQSLTSMAATPCSLYKKFYLK